MPGQPARRTTLMQVMLLKAMEWKRVAGGHKLCIQKALEFNAKIK